MNIGSLANLGSKISNVVNPLTAPHLLEATKPHVDLFLKIETIPGEAQDSKHKDEIDILSFSFGVSNSGTHHKGGGGGAGESLHEDFHFTHHFDKASPLLFGACADGTHIKKAVLTCRKAGGGQQDFLKLTMEDLLITEVDLPGKFDDHGRVIAAVSINFAKYNIEYNTQDEKGATKKAAAYARDIAKKLKS